jgi:hypothetical protein
MLIGDMFVLQTDMTEAERGQWPHARRFLAPWRRGAVDIASASGTRRPGFESRQSIRFLGKPSIAAVY